MVASAGRAPIRVYPPVWPYSLAINPGDTTVLYAGISNGVYKSTDGGTNWMPANSGLIGLTVKTLAIDPLNQANLYAGTELNGIFKSNDGGATWSATNSGLTNLRTRTLAIDSSNPAKLYVGTDSSGVFRSSDSGSSWIAANAGLTSLVVQALAIDPSNPDKLYAGTRWVVSSRPTMPVTTGRMLIPA